MDRKLFVFVSILITALLIQLLMLIYWGQKSMDLRQALFVDKVNLSIDEVLSDYEDNYYCFNLYADVALPKLDSFYIQNLPGMTLEEQDKLQLKYLTASGEERNFHHTPLIGPAQMHMQMHFEFDNIPEFKADSSLSSFEKYVRGVYKRYLVDENGVRLIDTVYFDSLLHQAVQQHHPEAELAYTVSLVEKNEVVFAQNTEKASFDSPDVLATMYSSDKRIPDLKVQLEVSNKDQLFAARVWNVYLSGALLALVSMALIFYLIRLQLQQRKLLRIQKDFVHGMTHEFNTPIANINLIAQKLLKVEDPKLQKAGDILQSEGRKLQAGINLVLTTALIEKNELLLEMQEIDVLEILNNLIRRNRNGLVESGIHLTLSLSEEKILTHGDAFHLENVFQNMINNVKKHSGAQSLNIGVEKVDEGCAICFSDDGKGIAEEDRTRIFEKFESSQKNGTKNGYGLGLYYSKMILEMHGGSIQLDSQRQKGSAFSIQLPA